MTDLLRLIVLVPLGYIAAVIAAALTVAFSIIGPDPGYGPGGIVVFASVITVYAGAASFLPALIAVAVAELSRIRSALFFMLIGGAIGFAVHQFAPYFGPPGLLQSRAVAFPAAGFVGGFVYWLIAGRLSGVDRREGEDEAA